MKRRFLPVAIVGILAGLLPAAGCSDHKILRVSDGVTMTFPDVMNDLNGIQLIFVGEHHDNDRHHEIQLEIIRGLTETTTRLAVGLEMFRKENQRELDQWVAGELSEGVFQKMYYKNWNIDWSLYRDIFLYAQQYKIPMIGLNIPREITRQVARKGFSSLTPEQLGGIPAVRCDVDKTYEEFIRRALGIHGHDKRMDFTNFCEAQVVWDTAMAWNLLAFLKEHPGYTVVVLAGSGHAWKRGIPEQVQRRQGVPHRVILPEMPDRLERSTVTVADTDYLWLGVQNE